jgi:phosphoserine phosphatase RsbU/P
MSTNLATSRRTENPPRPVPFAADEPPQQMRCMEVWGGSDLTDRGVEFGGLDAWVYSKPYGHAPRGGDVYYVSTCATGRIIRLLLADVAGHGQAVAKTAADLRTLMRRFVNCLDQSEFVRLLNRQFVELPREEAFATAVVLTYFAPTRRLMLCNAGHPRPLLYRAAERQWNFLGENELVPRSRPCNIPLGLLGVAEYEHLDVELQPGDYLLAYTDALIESSDADGAMLGEDGVLRILRLIGHVEPKELTRTLLREIADRYPENLCDDDVTVLLARATEGRAAYSVRAKFGAFIRFVRTLAGSVNPRAERAPFPDLNVANLGGAIFPVLARRWRARRATAGPRGRVSS